MELESRIPEKLFFRIGEVCELIKVQPHVLRYWETEFPMLAPQKNRAGQRVYRRKDVEMVMRIRDLLYGEKFTIAGARKKLMEEMRHSPARAKAPAREPEVDLEPVEEVEEVVETRQPDLAPAPQPQPQPPADQSISPQARRALRVIKRDLEDLLTMLNADASIKS
jgi:DNA-binding transcriptional MerR regulator